MRSGRKRLWKHVSSLTCCLWRCAGTSRAAGGAAATCSSTGAAASLCASSSSQGFSSSESVFSFSAVVPSELTEDDLRRERAWRLTTGKPLEKSFLKSSRKMVSLLFQIGLILRRAGGGGRFLCRLLRLFFLPPRKTDLNLMSL